MFGFSWKVCIIGHYKFAALLRKWHEYAMILNYFSEEAECGDKSKRFWGFMKKKKKTKVFRVSVLVNSGLRLCDNVS